MARDLILASASAARARLLAAAGVAFRAVPAPVDEAEARDSLRAAGADAGEAAAALAELKALSVSRLHDGALVIGADQMLACDGRWFEKPADREQARAQLQALAGRDHHLLVGAVAAIDGRRVWHHGSRVRMRMRPLSPGFIDAYLQQAGPAVLQSVGAYQLEGLGAQLFHSVEGDYFSVLGLPLLPLLAFLRGHGLLLAEA